MKTLYYIGLAAILLGTTAGCTSTVTLGPKANKDTCLNVSAGWSHVGVTLPWVQASSALHKDEK